VTTQGPVHCMLPTLDWTCQAGRTGDCIPQKTHQMLVVGFETRKVDMAGHLLSGAS
jgi:hypothetical protein